MAQTVRRYVALGGNRRYRYQLRARPQQDHGPRHGSQQHSKLKQQHDPGWQNRPHGSAWSISWVAWPLCCHMETTLVVTQTPCVCRTLSVNWSRRYQHRSSLLHQGHGPRHGSWQQPKSEHHHGQRSQSGHPH